MSTKFDIKKTFGINVRTARESRGLTQEHLAELIGIGVPALSNIECGKSYPQLPTFEKIVEVLEIEPYLLYINETDYNIEEAYSLFIQKAEKLKSNKYLFKRAYDFVNQLTKNL